MEVENNAEYPNIIILTVYFYSGSLHTSTKNTVF